ncbi:MAG: HlyD family secretion protein, partial [Aridibacter sp.]
MGISSNSKINSIEQAKNQKRIVEATFQQVQSQISAGKATVEQRKAQIPAAQAKLDNAQAELERSEKLFASGVVSRQNLEQNSRNVSEARANLISVQKQADIAEAQLNSLIRQVEVEKLRINEADNKIIAAENDYRQSVSEKNVASSQVGESAGRLEKANVIPEQLAIGSSEIQTAETEIAQAQVAVDQAELELSYTKIYAPQDDYVSRKSVVEGQLVQPDQTLMAISLPGIWVAANYKETQIGRIRVGQRVRIYVDAYPDQTFSGKVESEQAATGSRFSLLPAENSSGNYVKVVQRIPVKIVFDQIPDENILLAP